MLLVASKQILTNVSKHALYLSYVAVPVCENLTLPSELTFTCAVVARLCAQFWLRYFPMCSEFGLVLAGRALAKMRYKKCYTRQRTSDGNNRNAEITAAHMRQDGGGRWSWRCGCAFAVTHKPRLHDKSHEPPGTVIMGAAGNDLFCRWNRQMLMAEKSLAHLQRQRASKCSCVVPSSNLPHLFPNDCISSAELVEAFRRDMFSQPNQNQLERASLQPGYFVTTKISVPPN